MKLPTINVQHVWDIVIRSVKTALATYAAVVAAGGLNVLHVGTESQVKLASLAAVATALLNIGLKIHQAVTSPQPAQTAPVQPVVPPAPAV